MRCHRMDVGFHAADVSSADAPFFYCHAPGMCSWSYNARDEQQMRFRCLSPTSRKCFDVPFPFCFVLHLITGFSSNSPVSSNSPISCWRRVHCLQVHAEVRKKELLLLQQEVEIMFELMRYVSKQVVKRQGRMGWSCAKCVRIILEIRVVSLVTVLLFTTMYKSVSLALCSCNNCEEFSKSLLLPPLAFSCAASSGICNVSFYLQRFHVQQALVSAMYHFIFSVFMCSKLWYLQCIILSSCQLLHGVSLLLTFWWHVQHAWQPCCTLQL